MHTLFVCTGNICRSPIAERLAAKHSLRMGETTLEFSSAGTRAVVGQPIQAEAARVLEALGGDVADFQSRQLTGRIAASADLILTMTKAHREQVLQLAPRLLSRTFSLSEAAVLVSKYGVKTARALAEERSRLTTGEIVDVMDPIGQSSSFFANVGSQIDEMLQAALSVCITNDSASPRDS